MAIKPIQILIAAKDQASAVFGSVQAKMTALAAAASSFVGVALFTKSVQTAGDLEAALSRVAAAAGGGKEEFEKLKAAAENAGATTKYTASESAGALEELVKAGLSAEQAIAALPGTLALAQAGDIALAESAAHVTSVMAGFNLEASQTGRISDVLALGANSSKSSVDGLGQALSYAAPAAQSLHVPLETTVALLGKMADGGIDASRSGTSLANIMTKFSDPASEFRRELAAIGVTTSNFDQALHQLAASGARGEKAILAVGLNAGPALRSLLNQGMGALDELKNKLQNADGSAAETAKTMGSNLKGALSGLSSSWEALLIKLGEPVLPLVTQTVSALSDRLRAFVSDGTASAFGDVMVKAFQSACDWFLQFFNSIDANTVSARLQSIAKSAGDIFSDIGQKAATAAQGASLAWNLLASGVNTLKTIVYGVGSAITVVLSGCQQLISVVLTGLSKITFGEVSRGFADAAEVIKTSAEATMAAAGALFDKSKEALGSTADSAQAARDAWAGLTDSAGSAVQAQADIADKAKQAAQAMGEQASATAQMGEAAANAAKAQQGVTEATAATSERVKALQAEYDRLVAAGNLQAAAEKMAQIKQATQETSQAAGQAAQAMQGQAKATTQATAAAKSAAQAQNAMTEAAAQSRAQIEAMRAEYRRLIAAGDLQGAAAKMQEIERASAGAAHSAADLAREAEDAAKRLAAAFTAAGIKTRAELANMATQARENFELIRASGQASTQGLAAAWKKAADAAIEAANGVAPAWVRAEAAAHGYSVAVDGAGRASIHAAEQAKQAAQRTIEAYNNLAQAAESSSDRAVSAKEREIEASKRAQKQKEDEAKAYQDHWGTDASGFSRNTAGQTMSAKEPEAIFNQALIRYWGEDMLGSETARKATTLRRQLEYFDKLGITSSPDGSLADMRAELQRLIGVMDQERAARQRASQPQPITPKNNQQASTSTRRLVVNLPNGKTETLENLTANDASAVERVISQLAAAGRTSSSRR